MCIFLDQRLSTSHDLELFTDASGTIGFGGYFRGNWFQDRWPTNVWSSPDVEISMALLELVPIVVSVKLWGRHWQGKKIMMHCDNQSVVAIIRKGRSKIPAINRLMRALTLESATHNFFITAQYIPSKENSIADSLSRFQMERFRRLAPHAEDVPTPIPRSVQRLYST